MLDSANKLLLAIGSLPTVGVKNAHIDLLKQRLDFVLEDMAHLIKENARLTQENQELENKMAANTAPAEYTEHRGALFKRKPGGGYADQPVCPVCHAAMFSFQNLFEFECGDKHCARAANFTGNDIPSIMQELETL